MSEPRWLNEREMQAWQGLLAVSNLLERRIEQQLKADHGLSHTQYEILVRLSAAPDGELRMTELAQAVITSKSGLTYQVTQLEKAGLVRRRTCPTDVRGLFAVLTDDGHRLLDRAAPGHLTLVRELLIDRLTPEQLDLLAEGFGTIGRQLRTEA